MASEKEEETFQALKQQLLAHPDSAPVHYNMGLAYVRRRQWDEAISEFKAALEINPGMVEARINLGGVFICTDGPVFCFANVEQCLESFV